MLRCIATGKVLCEFSLFLCVIIHFKGELHYWSVVKLYPSNLTRSNYLQH